MKRLKKPAALLLLMLFVLTACTSGEEAATPVPTEAPVTTEAPAAAPEEAPAEPPAAEPADPPAEAPLSDEADEPYTPVDMNIGALKGPTGAGMAQLMERDALGETANDYSFTLSAAPDEVLAKIINGELDVAAVPTNSASVLWNRTQGGVQVAALNTLGVLYIMQNAPEGTETISSLEELRGKTLYATGQGANPEYVLNHLLRANGLEPGVDVSIEYLAAHDELVALAASGEVEYCMLPEPNVTVAKSKNPDMQVVIDLTEVWDSAVEKGGGVLTMGCVVVRSEFAQSNPEAVSKFLEEYESSVALLSEDVAAAAALVAKYEIVAGEQLAAQAIPNCNAVFIAGEDIRPALEPYYQVLMDADPTSIGGAMPDEGFYFTGN